MRFGGRPVGSAGNSWNIVEMSVATVHDLVPASSIVESADRMRRLPMRQFDRPQ
jgi:hypothetical protein